MLKKDVLNMITHLGTMERFKNYKKYIKKKKKICFNNFKTSKIK